MRIPPDLVTEFLGSLRRCEFAKKETLLMQGEISKHAYFVEEGCLRIWHNNHGTDITLQFFLKGDLVSSLESFFRGVPSNFGIEAIAPTKAWAIERKEFEDLMSRSEELRGYIFDAMVDRVSDYQNLFLNRIMETPENRYRHLLEHSPELLEAVPLHYLASYLGITPVSLSRIRKKVGVP